MEDRIIMHVDINFAFLAMEAAYRLQCGEMLDIRTIPSVIGGNEEARHGIVLAKSNLAKKAGIKTGESLWNARLKCPGLLVIPPNYKLYIKASKGLTEILKRFAPVVEQFSIDEAWMDYTNMDKNFGYYYTRAIELKETIKKELGFTVSVGISSNKILSKMASDLKKPDAVTTLFPNEIKEKMWPLPVEDLFMVGSKTKKKLNDLNIKNIGQLAASDPQLIYEKLKSHGLLIHGYANGIDNSPVRMGQRFEMKGIGNSSTSSKDLTTRQEVVLFIRSLVETMANRMREAGKMGRVFSLGLRTSGFMYYSHQIKYPVPTNITSEIMEIYERLLDELWKKEPLRHVGVRTSELYDEYSYQLTFFDNPRREKLKALDRTIDELRDRYGSNSIFSASFINSGLRYLNGGYPEDEYPPMSSIL